MLRHSKWLSINRDSGAWLSAGVSPKMFEMSSSEFVSAICRRNTVEDLTIPKYTPLISREDPELIYCACDAHACLVATSRCFVNMRGAKLIRGREPKNE